MGIRTGVLAIQAGTVITASGDSRSLQGNNPGGIPYQQGLPVEAHDVLAVDISVTALAGTAPTVQFFYDRQGLDGVWYPVYNTPVMSAAGNQSTTLAGANSASQEFGFIGRLRWVVAGTTPSITFSASITGK